MYRDNTLVPAEATRLLALGLLMEKPMSYAMLAQTVRGFTSLVVGPSLDLIGTPLEVLKVEGLVSLDKTSDAETLSLTDAGQEEFVYLMGSNLRAPITDMSKLIIAIKMRLLHLADQTTQTMQVNLLVDIYERQLNRLLELKQGYSTTEGQFGSWLDLDIKHTTEQLKTYEDMAEDMAKSVA
ncbi:hypothetical protein WH96_12635 [Kiloniella spongiae]|uniref:Uncharacterized protein n=1 Tax=Kiloniella spongiae TaxID=1489064 RepID=A0A0H2MIH7_9PROT|nr:hypothetical protein [Kiloniella spongiae]KLN60542.1 hypothetical protein WH96_12635 [Kiloniella spongiae]